MFSRKSKRTLVVSLRAMSSMSGSGYSPITNIAQNLTIRRFYQDVAIQPHPLNPSKEWAVTLNGTPIKTVYKDSMRLPTKAFAMAVAQEWQAQQQFLNMRTMPLTQFVGKAIRVSHDRQLRNFYTRDIRNILENDQISYRDNIDQSGGYKKQLVQKQMEASRKLINFLKQKYQIELYIFHDLAGCEQHESFMKISDVLESMVGQISEQNNWEVMALYTIASISKSTAIGLALIEEFISLQEAVEIARMDQDFQSELYGKVEGAHDIDQIHTLTSFATAKVALNLLKEF